MQLLKLRSDNPKFRTLDFRPGLNIVAGIQKSDKDTDSFNGIGKSLSLKLIHYVLGAALDNKKLKSYLAGYGCFHLEFLHKGKHYLISKDFSQSDYIINGQKINQTAYPKELSQLFLGDKAEIGFRQVFNCFARRFGGTYYADPLSQQGRPITDYKQRLTNLYLLGIDTDLVRQRFATKKDIGSLNNAAKAIKEYEKSLDKANLKDLADEIADLKNKRDHFVIAESYDLLKKQADDLTAELNELRNKKFFLERTLEKKEISLKREVVNIDVAQIADIYHEAQFFFGKEITQRLSDAQHFHNALVNNRKNRLIMEVSQLKTEIAALTGSLEKCSAQRDGILKDLDNSGALEEFNSLAERIKSLEIESENLKKYEHLLRDFKKEKSNLDSQNALIKERSILYLEEKDESLEAIENEFRVLAKPFYGKQAHHGASLKIQETKDAQYLFDIQLQIPKDESQAVGEVKIFCYDVLLYKLNKDLLGFMAHDGCIFSEMDPRQKSTMFKIILNVVREEKCQYFLNIAQNSLIEVLDAEQKVNILTAEEKQMINDALILELYDKDPENWLFGEDFSA
ncbi:DUF2326 domain-containing protein [Methylovulum psychrotolerans]|uniref:DUF2326 domain-containing protein n=1 Tax=Methylovulum psychrotolerans TaxID=1704499 RepID=A0A2S5CQG3_9GAMM|nr:DUF2326 domain-containing protein [Methylovulum psychrotolerans]POZ52992.1 hypothetical protein AADEFJLK_00001 [Methylovulum psychrotolerans]